MKKILSILLCVCVLTSGLTMLASANTYTVTKNVTVREFNSNANNTYLFYNNLTANQKKVYNAVVNQKAGLDNNGTITLDFGSSFYSNTESGLSNALETAIVGGLAAAIDDYPEYFWIGAYKMSMSYSQKNGNYYLSSSSLTFSVGNTIKTDYASFAAVKTAYNQMISKIKSITISGSNRYQKVKAIHDKIAELNTYDYTFNAKMNHDPTGVFLNGTSVCEGYSEAFKLLCDREGIPCILVVGTAVSSSSGEGEHEWNAVQMDDGEWYGVDVTWDDQDKTSKLYYDFFLTGSNTVDVNFGKKSWSYTHKPDGLHFPDSSYALKYPTLASNTYTEWANKNGTPKLTSIDNATKGIQIKWNALSGAGGYYVFRKNSAGGWDKIGTVTNALTYTDTTAKSGTKYTYTVRAFKGSIKSKYDATGLTLLRLANPTTKVGNAANGLKVSWSKVAGAKGYIVYRKAAGESKFTKLGAGTNLYYTDKKAKAGVSYTYAVRAYNGSITSWYTAVSSVRLTNPAFTLAKASGGIKVSISKVTSAKGYYIYRKTGSGSYAKIATVTSLSYVDKTAKAGTKYTYAVRAYNGKVLSAYNEKAITR